MRIFCNIHPAMSAVILVVDTPYFTVSSRDGEFEIASVTPGDYQLKVFHERATESVLQGLERKIMVGPENLTLPTMEISESGYLPASHKNKYGKDYPNTSGGRLDLPRRGQLMFGFSRLSLLWKTLLSTSIAITLLFAITVWIVQQHVVQSTSESLEDEVRASFRAYESLWRAHADKLASISLILSTMSDVRAAFTTGDQATIRDTAAELWNRVSDRLPQAWSAGSRRRGSPCPARFRARRGRHAVRRGRAPAQARGPYRPLRS